MLDTIHDEVVGVEITPYVSKTVRTPSLTQVVNTSLNGLTYVQNIGRIIYKVQVDFVIHKDNDALLLTAWHSAHMVKVVDDGAIYYGYIIDLELDTDYADGYHSGSILIQEERVE